MKFVFVFFFLFGAPKKVIQVGARIDKKEKYGEEVSNVHKHNFL